jgi:MtrB/PioB family decaheme-associated outer membrane protein
MEKRIGIAFAMMLAIAPASYAEQSDIFSGGVFLGGNALSIDHKSGKFDEYNEVAPGFVGGGNGRYDNDKYYLNAEGSYLGSDDMYFKLKGGKWGDFKFSLFYTEFPHNYSFGDKSVFVNPGSQTQALAPGATYNSLSNVATWPSQSFDQKIVRKDVGGSADVTAIRPFFFNIEANRLQREGQKVFGAVDALATSGTSSAASGGAFTSRMVDVAVPINDHTTNANALFGWKNKQFYAAFGGGLSEYGNSAEFTRFQEPFFPPTGAAPANPAIGTIVGPPDNRSWDMRFTGTAKLPYASVFSLNADYQRNTSHTTLLNSIETGTQASPVIAPLRLSSPVFNGNVEYWHLNNTLTSNPTKDLTTKFYFKYLDRKDNSDIVTFANPAAPTVAPVSNSLYSFEKTSVGGEATYRFMKNLKGILGYDFTDTRREDLPITANVFNNIPDTWVHTYNAQLVYNPFDWLGGRLRYQKLYQNANIVYEPGTAVNTVLQNNDLRFDAQDKTQDMFKLTADVTPIDALSIAIEYAYKKDNYHDSALGFQQMEENEFILDGNYVVKGVKLFAFLDYDYSHTSQMQRQGTGGNGDPNSPPSPTGFNWNAELRNQNYAYGLGSSLPLMSKLSLIVQYDFEKNNGWANFTSQSFTAAQTALGINNSNINNPFWDGYTRQNISARFVYDYNEHLAFSLGYLYSQFRANDGQYIGYQYVALPGTAAGASYLSGTYIDQNYKANIYYLRVAYRF